MKYVVQYYMHIVARVGEIVLRTIIPSIFVSPWMDLMLENK
jgi:hypothetical protein